MRLVLAFIFFFFLESVSGQRYSFVEYSTKAGLPQSQVTAITQDQDGYLWVGTLGGLAKFNGKDFVSYTRENGLVNNKIISLSFFKNTLWVGHEGGVSKYHQGKFSNWTLPNDSKNIQVTQIIPFGDKILIGTNGGGLFELKNDQILPVHFEEEGSLRIRDILFFKGVFYIATRDGVYQTNNFKSFRLQRATYGWSVSDLEIYKNQICITTYQDGIHLYNPADQQFFEIKLDKELNLASSFADEQGKLWIAAAEGVLQYENGKVRLINDEKGIPRAGINRVFQDDEQNIWVGSAGKGLICFSGEQFVHHNQSTGLPSDLVVNVNQDKKGQFWISTFNKGLVLQKTNGEFTEVYNDILTFWCSAMNVNGFNWFGTDLGLFAFDGTHLQKKFTPANGLLGEKITTLYKISSNQMFIGGSSGLMLYSSGHLTVLHDNENFDIGTIRDIEQLNGSIYLATDKGFYVYRNRVVKSVKNFSKTTFCLVLDSQNNLWLGTEEGLYQYKNGEIINRNFSNETASIFINFLNYRKGTLYIGTNNGLYTYVPSSNGAPKKIHHFGIEEGVVNLETNLNSSFFDNRGRLWFGTASGLVIFTEDKKSQKEMVPRLLLNQLLLNYQRINFTPEQLKNLSFHYTKNNISFNFDGISLSYPKELRYQYWLEGSDPGWSPPSTSPIINYTGLRSGNYVLHARAIGPQMLLSKEIKIPFEIRSPFYFAWWFILLLAVLLGGLVYLFIRVRLQREREKGEKEKMVIQNKLLSLEQQSLNASMNRHFIFNSLNSIQYFINTQDRTSANKYLTNFAQLIRKNLDASTSEGNMVPLSKEIDRLKLYLNLESMRFKDRFDSIFELDIPDAENIFIPSMLLQPFVENSIVHGILPKKEVKGLIKTKAWIENSILHISIEDNGIGISQSLKTKHNFKGDHRSQGMEITAKRISLIKQISKKGFEIIGPQDIMDNNHSINGTYVLLKIPFEHLEN